MQTKIAEFPTWPLLLATASLIGYGAFIALGSEAAFPEAMHTQSKVPYLSDKPVGEDGFYMLTVAWNLAKGEGLTYNYNLPTSGIQPLATFLYAGAAWTTQALGGDRWTFLRVVLLLGLFNLIALGWVVGRIAQEAFDDAGTRRAAFLLAGSAIVFNFWLYRALTYGLETGLYLLLFALCISFYIRVASRMHFRHAVVLGALAGLTGLARIDFGVVLFFFLAAGVLMHWLRWSHAFLIGIVALAMVSPWFLYVQKATGSWFPSSGGAQSSLVTLKSLEDRTAEMLEALINHITPWLYTGSRPALSIIGVLSLAAILLAIRFFRQREPVPIRSNWRSAMTLWGVAVAPLPFIYVTFFWATHFYERYSAPLLVLLLPAAVAIGLRHLPDRYTKWVCAVPLLLLTCFGAWTYLSLHRGTIGNTHAVTAGFVEERYPPPYRVGAFQSGVIGYFNPNVFNLDGKLDPEALAATESDRLDVYVDSLGINVLIDWPGYLRRLPANYLDTKWKPCPELPNNSITRCFLLLSAS